jgi:hypothetical protein
MRRNKGYRWTAKTAAATLGLAVAISIIVAPASAEETRAEQAAAASPDQAGVPRLVNFSGILRDASGKVTSGNVTLVLSLYEEQEGGSPLWSETQAVTADDQGHYTVLLGATQPEGLPQDLFTSTRARWLGVAPQLPAVGELPRALLVGMPYALKASDADTLGGKPASAYVTMDALSAAPGYGMPAGTVKGGVNRPNLTALIEPPATPLTAQPQDGTPVGGTGTANYLPLWTDASTLGNSALFQNGTNVGIGTATPANTLDVNGGGTVRGELLLPPINTATLDYAWNSNPLDLQASTFDLNGFPEVQDFRWQAEPSGNGGFEPSGTLNLLFGAYGNTPMETGLSISGTGVITFAPGQTFPTVTGNETVTGSLTAAADSANTFSLPQTSGPSSGVLDVAGSSFLHDAGGTSNTFVGSSAGGAFSNTGSSNSALGYQALYSNSVGGYNTAIGSGALQRNTGGSFNTALGEGSLDYNGTGSNNTAVGVSAGANSLGSSDTFIGASAIAGASNLNNATAIGASAVVAESNALVLGGIGSNAVNVGIGTSTPVYPLTLAADDNGSSRGGPHQFMIQGVSNPSKQLLIGYLADGGGDAGYGMIQATDSGVENTTLALNPNGGFVGINNRSPQHPLQMGDGAYEDGGTWTNSSDRNLKENFAPVDGSSVLAKLKAMPMQTWNYRADPAAVRHLGPMAQDFYAAFGLGHDDKHISTVDEGGVALAAIQALYQMNLEKDAQIKDLTAAVQELKADVVAARESLQRVKGQLAERHVEASNHQAGEQWKP